MPLNKHDIEELIIKQLSGEATEEESRELSNLRENDEMVEKLWSSYEKTWKKLDHESAQVVNLDIDSEWQQLSNSISFEEKESKEENFYSIEPEQKPVSWLKYTRVAAVLFIITVAGIALISYFSNPPVRYTTASAIQEYDLPDGSLVTLNGQSLVKFNKEFKGNKREVYLEGEAYFQVEHNPDKPFLVKAGNTTIEVLGTEFNVKAYYEDDEIHLDVTKGRVAFSSRNSEEPVIVEANQKAFYSKKSQSISAVNPAATNALAWKTRFMDFNNTTLEEIIETLESVYLVKFEFANEEIQECTITVQFSDQELQSVLTVLEATLNVEFTEEEGTFIVSGEGC